MWRLRYTLPHIRCKKKMGREIFQQLVAYVWQGGMPGWKDDSRPDYVLAMGKAIRGTTSPVFQGLSLKPPAPCT
jgi:hypothetical protein